MSFFLSPEHFRQADIRNMNKVIRLATIRTERITKRGHIVAIQVAYIISSAFKHILVIKMTINSLVALQNFNILKYVNYQVSKVTQGSFPILGSKKYSYKQ
jgi:hypothetical protein